MSDERKLCCTEDAIGLHTTIRIEWTREEPHPPTKEETFIITILQLVLLFTSITALEGSGCTTASGPKEGRPKSISNTHTQNNPLCIKAKHNIVQKNRNTVGIVPRRNTGWLRQSRSDEPAAAAL